MLLVANNVNSINKTAMDSRKELTLSTMALMDRSQLQRLEEKYVTRTIKCVPDKFISLCHMHLAFLLDLSDHKLDTLLSAHTEHRKKRPSLVTVGVFKKKEKPQTDLFGAPLTEEGVSLMVPLINFLKLEKNICKEGLFRKSGNKNRMATLRQLLVIQGKSFSIDHEIYSPYDVACVLKEFLRELPEPLLTEHHMEAHRQVTALGSHASTPDEVARYTQRKLSALQLLVLLLPAPVQKLTMHVLRLLQRIADCVETKMTPTTLGTIFAPIFCIDRSIEGSELCAQISQMTPAVSFMIEMSHELCHAPKELLIDLANYWNVQTSPSVEDFSDSCQVKNSAGGHTLNTNVCYIDRELSRCDDVASNTQAELANLYAHLQSLPDTPNNNKFKKQLLKSTSTPVSSAKKFSHSSSISASIKKRLPSLGRSKKKNSDISSDSGSTSSSHDTKTIAPSLCELLESPACTPEKKGQQCSRTRHKIQCSSEINENSTSCECTPPKQQRRSTEISDTTTLVNVKQNLCQDNFNRKKFSHENRDPSSQNFSTNIKTRVRSSSASPLSRVGLSPTATFLQSEKEITYLPYLVAKKITAPVTPNKNSTHVTKLQPRPFRGPCTPVIHRLPLKATHNTLETSI